MVNDAVPLVENVVFVSFTPAGCPTLFVVTISSDEGAELVRITLSFCPFSVSISSHSSLLFFFWIFTTSVTLPTLSNVNVRVFVSVVVPVVSLENVV